jgi:hypothetical protein
MRTREGGRWQRETEGKEREGLKRGGRMRRGGGERRKRAATDIDEGGTEEDEGWEESYS